MATKTINALPVIATSGTDNFVAQTAGNVTGRVSVSQLETWLDYYRKTQFVAASTGAPDAGKPVLLDGAGKLDSSFMSTSVPGDFTVTGKLNVGGLIDPLGMIFDEAAAPSTTATQGGLFVSDGSGGLTQNKLYFRPGSDGTPVELGSGGGGSAPTSTSLAYVDPNRSDAVDNNDLTTAFLTIQGAVDAAANAGGGTVYVVPGTYDETVYVLNDGISIYGLAPVGDLFGQAPKTVIAPSSGPAIVVTQAILSEATAWATTYTTAATLKANYGDLNPPVQATGTVTVGTPIAGSQLTIGGVTLVGVAVPRTPGANDFNVGAAVVSDEIAAAINDGANSFTGLVTASSATPVVTLTAVPIGEAGNAITLATNDPPNLTLSGANLTGGKGSDVQSFAIGNLFLDVGTTSQPALIAAGVGNGTTFLEGSLAINNCVVKGLFAHLCGYIESSRNLYEEDNDIYNVTFYEGYFDYHKRNFTYNHDTLAADDTNWGLGFIGIFKCDFLNSFILRKESELGNGYSSHCYNMLLEDDSYVTYCYGWTLDGSLTINDYARADLNLCRIDGNVTIDNSVAITNINFQDVAYSGSLSDPGGRLVDTPPTNAPGGTDSNAIHVNAANEISGLTEKASPAAADLVVIEDSAAGFVKKKVQVTNIGGGGGGLTPSWGRMGRDSTTMNTVTVPPLTYVGWTYFLDAVVLGAPYITFTDDNVNGDYLEIGSSGAGIYLVGFDGTTNATPAFGWDFRFSVNGTPTGQPLGRVGTATSTDFIGASLRDFLTLSVGDKVRFEFYNRSSSITYSVGVIGILTLLRISA